MSKVIIGFAERNAKTEKEGLLEAAVADLQKKLDVDGGEVFAIGTHSDARGIHVLAAVPSEKSKASGKKASAKDEKKKRG